jgi:hypothetical protein
LLPLPCFFSVSPSYGGPCPCGRMKNMLRRSVVGILFCIGPYCAVAQPLDVPSSFQQGLLEIHNGNFRQAMETSKALRSAFPQHPLTFLIAVEAYWGMIYCQTGHITSREIWNVADTKTSSYDGEFFRAVDKALELSDEMRLNPASAAAGALYAGLARGARARLYALREQSLKSASDAKQMRADLLEAIAKDPQLAPDADLGLGTYNYYADVLSPLLKLFRLFLGIPGGDRQKGLEQLRTASEQAVLWKEEAKYELARIYGVREGRHSEALSLFQELAEQYPQNSLYALFAGFQAELTGKGGAAMAIEYCQKAREAAAKLESDCRDRMLEVAKGALERLQGSKAVGKKD